MGVRVRVRVRRELVMPYLCLLNFRRTRPMPDTNTQFLTWDCRHRQKGTLDGLGIAHTLRNGWVGGGKWQRAGWQRGRHSGESATVLEQPERPKDSL